MKEISREFEKPCSDISTCFQAVEDLPWQQSNLGEYRQLSLWKSTPTLKPSCDRTSQEFQSIATSETITPEQESLTSSHVDFLARVQATQALEQDLNIQLPLFGEKELDASWSPSPASVLLSNLKELSDEDFELFLEDSEWQDTLGKLKQSRRRSLERVTKDSDCLSFPTLTSGDRSTSRPAGQTKCEKWFKDKGLIKSGYQLGTRAIAQVMGFPSNWFEGLTEQYSKNPNTPSQVKFQAESEVDTLQGELLLQDKQRSPSAESSISQKLLVGEEKLLEHKRGECSSPEKKLSIPCIVKQPKQPEVKGIIKQDLGDRFTVYIPDSDSTITVSKLFVHPDLSQLGKFSSKTTPLSTKKSSKTRRLKGEGSGAIFYRTVTRNGKDYQQAYYHWRENGKQKTKYIPKKLIGRVEEAESRKLPVSDILFLLVGTDKCSSKKSDICKTVSFRTSITSTDTKVIDSLNKCSSKTIPTSKTRRTKGKGSGWIQCKPIKRSGKEYQQYWYHYEEWREGDRTSKKCRYIPKHLVARVEKLNGEKVPVEEILKFLRSKNDNRKTIKH